MYTVMVGLCCCVWCLWFGGFGFVVCLFLVCLFCGWLVVYGYLGCLDCWVCFLCLITFVWFFPVGYCVICCDLLCDWFALVICGTLVFFVLSCGCVGVGTSDLCCGGCDVAFGELAWCCVWVGVAVCVWIVLVLVFVYFVVFARCDCYMCLGFRFSLLDADVV